FCAIVALLRFSRLLSNESPLIWSPLSSGPLFRSNLCIYRVLCLPCTVIFVIATNLSLIQAAHQRYGAMKYKSSVSTRQVIPLVRNTLTNLGAITSNLFFT